METEKQTEREERKRLKPKKEKELIILVSNIMNDFNINLDDIKNLLDNEFIFSCD